MACCESPNVLTRKYVGTEETYRYCTGCFAVDSDLQTRLQPLMEGAIKAEELFSEQELEDWSAKMRREGRL